MNRFLQDDDLPSDDEYRQKLAGFYATADRFMQILEGVDRNSEFMESLHRENPAYKTDYTTPFLDNVYYPFVRQRQWEAALAGMDEYCREMNLLLISENAAMLAVAIWDLLGFLARAPIHIIYESEFEPVC